MINLLIGLAVGFISYPLFKRYLYPKLLTKLDELIQTQKEKLEHGKKIKRAKAENQN